MELYHHGVKGQEWGVRNGPPYPIEDKVMRKGHTVASVTTQKSSKKYKSTGRAMYTYNPNDKWDSKVYKGPFSRWLSPKRNTLQIIRNKSGVYEHTFETTKDLKMPTAKERFDEFKNILNGKETNSDAIKELKSVQYLAKDYGVGSEKMRDLNLDKMKGQSDYKYAYELFNLMMEASHMYTTTSKYMQIMSTKYDAMIDDNNQGVYNGAHDPVIIFRVDQVLKDIGSRELKISEINKNLKEVEETNKKEGRATKF